MRYLANQLGWRNDALLSRSWVNDQGSEIQSMFSFGGPHAFQTPQAHVRRFAAESFTLEQAKSWLSRAPFESLMIGHPRWCEVMTEALEMNIPMNEADAQSASLRLTKNDYVLRVAYPMELDELHLSDMDILDRLVANRDMLRFYLHFITDFEPNRSQIWDAGL